LLYYQKEKERIRLILERIFQVYEDILQDNDYYYLKHFILIIKELRKRQDLAKLLNETEDKIASFIESLLLEGKQLPHPKFFLEVIKKPSFDFETYIDIILDKEKTNPYVLELFLNFFSHKLPIFYENIKKRNSDIEFIKKLINNLKTIDSFLVLDILKFIFSFGNKLIKIEVIKTMQDISYWDREFLFSVLKKGEIFLKKEVVIVFVKKNKGDEIVRVLLSVFNPLGIRNRILKENVDIIKELKLKEARNYLVALSKRKLFWYKSIKKEINEILKEWDERKS
jgi:hypothetical protein